MKIKALPFLLGSSVGSFFIGDWSFTISIALLFSLLVLTKQVDLY